MGAYREGSAPRNRPWRRLLKQERRSHVVEVKFNTEEFELLNAVSNEQGMTRPASLRAALRWYRLILDRIPEGDALEFLESKRK